MILKITVICYFVFNAEFSAHEKIYQGRLASEIGKW
jgi:hypothetical protein